MNRYTIFRGNFEDFDFDNNNLESEYTNFSDGDLERIIIYGIIIIRDNLNITAYGENSNNEILLGTNERLFISEDDHLSDVLSLLGINYKVHKRQYTLYNVARFRYLYRLVAEHGENT